MLDRFLDYLDKAKSRVYGVYVFWLLVGFSPAIFIALFVDQDLIYKETHLLKNEYVRQEYLNLSSWQGWVYVSFVIIGAALMTRLVIWDFPKWFVNRAYKQEVRNQFAKEEMLVEEQDKLERKRNKVADKKADTAEKEKKAAEQRQQVEEREEDKWQNDYNKFKKTSHYDRFYLIPESIYEHSGQISIWDSYRQRYTFEIPTELLSYADGTGLIDVDVPQRTISLTEKGRYFMMQYQTDRSKKV